MKPSVKCPLPEGVKCSYRQHLEQLEEDAEKFAYIVSHDLREPLMGITGFATLLRHRSSDLLNSECRHFLDQIIDGTKRMETKLNDLLAFSKASQTKPNGSFALGAAVEEAKRSLARRITETEATVEIRGDLPLVCGDRGMVAQVFQNLLSNSLKYRHKNTPPHVIVEARTNDKGLWEITVKDNGIGFDMRHKDRVFGVFQRLYTVEEYPGTGIGLAIARKIVERHGGQIWTESKPNDGATFYFTLLPAQS